VWHRLEKIYDLYGARDRLASVHGRGSVTGKPPEATHCNNIGAVHRPGIYAALNRWFDMPAPAGEPHDRRPPEALTSLTPEVLKEVRPRPVYELAAELGRERARAARDRLAGLPPEQRLRRLREEWAKLLGTVEPRADVRVSEGGKLRVGDVTVERIRLEVEPGVEVPLLLLVPGHRPEARLPVVTAFAQEGKQALLKGRAEELARLLEGGSAVALPDLRGTGETRPGGGRGRQTAATSLASSELMLGQTLVGSRLRDLRAVLRYLRGRADLDPRRLALWGDSFAPVNPAGRNPAVPLDADRLPDQAEPLGGLLALFGALYEEGVTAVFARGGLVNFQSLLHSPFCSVPYDILIPGALTAGDLDDVAAALAPRPLRLEGLVDGLNRRVPAGELAKALGPVRAAYRDAPGHLRIEAEAKPGESTARWLLGR
jgi:hypothetical protein